MRLRIAHDAAASEPRSPGFKLRLQQGDDRPAGRQVRARTSNEKAQRDERRVDRYDRERGRKRVVRQKSEIRAFENAHAESSRRR